jgi:hypothetical protein
MRWVFLLLAIGCGSGEREGALFDEQTRDAGGGGAEADAVGGGGQEARDAAPERPECFAALCNDAMPCCEGATCALWQSGDDEDQIGQCVAELAGPCATYLDCPDTHECTDGVCRDGASAMLRPLPYGWYCGKIGGNFEECASGLSCAPVATDLDWMACVSSDP